MNEFLYLSSLDSGRIRTRSGSITEKCPAQSDRLVKKTCQALARIGGLPSWEDETRRLRSCGEASAAGNIAKVLIKR